MSNKDNENSPLFSIGHIDITQDQPGWFDDSLSDLPILPTRNLVLFPGVHIPIRIGREDSLRVANAAYDNKISIGVVCQNDPDDDNPDFDGLYKYGVLADVLKVIPLPDGSHSAIVHAREKIRLTGAGRRRVNPNANISASFRLVNEIVPKKSDTEFYDVIIRDIRALHKKFMQKARDEDGSQAVYMSFDTDNIDPVLLVNTLATNGPFDIGDKMDMLKEYRIKQRALLLHANMIKYEAMAEIARGLHEKARESFDEQQRRAFLQRQMEVIDQELNGDDSDFDELRRRADEAGLPEKIMTVFDKELDKLGRLNPQSPDYSVQYTYLDTILSLPWNKSTEPTNDFAAARDILENDHYGLNKVKERILEQLAVVMHNPAESAPIICLVGPPGVGKTSIGSSVARALNRNFGRISLGGVHDEAEIRGHRRTYIGAMPGRIIDAIRRADSSNPLIMLDEIDKLGKDYKGDPSSALLEVLDPEQNNKFHDNYIDLDFDLSSVMFIATANDLSTVPRPLLDRMEVIEIPGYLPEEKREIAVRHLLPRRLKRLDISPEDVSISDEAIKKIITDYTSESGVRQLDKQLTSILRKLLKEKLLSGEFDRRVIDAQRVRELLGAEQFDPDKYEGNEYAGVVTGLAWTSAGGDILYIEAALSPGKGHLTMTGSLGDVMKESATLALQYVKSHTALLGVNPELLSKYDIHIHFPAGAVPKDGPSAGVTIVTAIVSALRQKRVKAHLAMTGEITLRGKVLAVGGIREKLLAARRGGIKEILLPDACRNVVEEIEPELLDGLSLHFVKTVPEVINLALTDEDPVDALIL